VEVCIDSVVIAGADDVTASCGDPNTHVADAGSPLQLSETVPLNALLGATLIDIAAAAPTATLVTGNDALTLNVCVPVVGAPLVIAPNRPCVSPSGPAVK